MKLTLSTTRETNTRLMVWACRTMDMLNPSVYVHIQKAGTKTKTGKELSINLSRSEALCLIAALSAEIERLPLEQVE